MPGSLRIGKIAGITIEVHASWLIIFVLLTVSLATGWFPYVLPHRSFGFYLLLGAVASVLLFVSVLAHELAHSLVARARGLPVRSITLFIFGGVSNLEREPRSAGVELQMAIVGPLTSLLIGAISLPLSFSLQARSPVWAAVLAYLGASNLLLGAFNLIPGFPLDGGRVLRSAIWKATGDLNRATRWAARVGQVVAYFFILVGVWLFFTGDIVGGLWLGFIGWFLLSAAHAEAARAEFASLFRGVTVGEVMNSAPVSVPASISLQDAVNEFMVPSGLRAVPVTRLGRLVGLIALADIRKVPRERWTMVPVAEVMTPVERVRTASPSQPLEEALPWLAEGANQLPVVEQDQLVGMLSADTVLRMLEMRRSLGPRHPADVTSQELPRAS